MTEDEMLESETKYPVDLTHDQMILLLTMTDAFLGKEGATTRALLIKFAAQDELTALHDLLIVAHDLTHGRVAATSTQLPMAQNGSIS